MKRVQRMTTMWEVRQIFWDELDVENEREEEIQMNSLTLYLSLALTLGSFPASSVLPDTTMTSNLGIDLRPHGPVCAPVVLTAPMATICPLHVVAAHYLAPGLVLRHLPCPGCTITGDHSASEHRFETVIWSHVLALYLLCSMTLCNSLNIACKIAELLRAQG